MKSRVKIFLAATIIVVAVLVGSFAYIYVQRPFLGSPESVTLGVYPSEYSSLIYIAKDQGFFSSNGLEITIKNYPSGAASVRGMLDGEVNIATASEFVVVNNALQNANICALGSVSKYLNLYVLAREDQGINSPSDLNGKRIGVPLGTANQFFLGRFLELNGILSKDVTLVNVNFVETPKAIANGTIDAVMTFQPYINQVKSLLSDKIVMWPAQSDQYGYFEAISTRTWTSENPELAVGFMRALVEAESYNINHEDQAIAKVARDLNYSESYTASVWPDYKYSVGLDQSFVLLMQEEARWLIDNKLSNATFIPNFLNYIYAEGLSSVRSSSINIIGLGD